MINIKVKLIAIPTTPIPSGDMPKNQNSELFNSGEINLKKTI
tara:strand:+ start:1003 stop:1128 length:126 start_codon:yes stop_codon:yes gene_type:complete